MNTLTCCVSCICSHCSVFPVSTDCWGELSHKRTRRNIRCARFTVSHTAVSFPSTPHHLRPITLLYAHSHISWGSPYCALFGLLYMCSPVASPPYVWAVQRGTSTRFYLLLYIPQVPRTVPFLQHPSLYRQSLLAILSVFALTGRL